MDKKQFIEFVENTLIHLMAEHGLDEISVKDGKGNKAKVRKNADGLFVVDITRTELIY